MTAVERYRELFEHERDSNDKMLTMIESVPEDRRLHASYQRAVNLAAHIAACRENWLDRLTTKGENQRDWFPDAAQLSDMRPRYAEMEQAWSDYLAGLSEEDLAREFEIGAIGGKRYRWYVEGQILQMIGHAFYHRGQVSLLVDELGGETVDTDYLYWAYQRNPRYGLIE